MASIDIYGLGRDVRAVSAHFIRSLSRLTMVFSVNSDSMRFSMFFYKTVARLSAPDAWSNTRGFAETATLTDEDSSNCMSR